MNESTSAKDKENEKELAATNSGEPPLHDKQEEISSNKSPGEPSSGSSEESPKKSLIEKVADFFGTLKTNLRLTLYVIFGGCAILFMVQNLTIIRIHFAWFEFRIFQFVALLGMLVIGFVAARVWDAYRPD